ncbi:MAG: hypothetical protein D6773_18965 [Alphaproteobacteria bacterium]|nr:MAG: hypothetical protein D6773_18965 [Alphaproteobacteria bacterium]
MTRTGLSATVVLAAVFSRAPLNALIGLLRLAALAPLPPVWTLAPILNNVQVIPLHDVLLRLGRMLYGQECHSYHKGMNGA